VAPSAGGSRDLTHGPAVPSVDVRADRTMELNEPMLNQVADGVWVRQSEWVWTNSIVVRGEQLFDASQPDQVGAAAIVVVPLLVPALGTASGGVLASTSSHALARPNHSPPEARTGARPLKSKLLKRSSSAISSRRVLRPTIGSSEDGLRPTGTSTLATPKNSSHPAKPPTKSKKWSNASGLTPHITTESSPTAAPEPATGTTEPSRRRVSTPPEASLQVLPGPQAGPLGR
jgi:hypothetical protein